MSLLMNSDAHRDALLKVLDQAYVDHDVSIGQFGSIIGSVTACNVLSFGDEDLPEEGRNHNLALHISVNCKADALSNVLIDTGSSLNVMPKETFDQLEWQGSLVRKSGLVVRAFDGSRKSVLGEVDLPITIGPHIFQITFQIMDVNASYSCLLGRPWIHEAGAVTSTLHQKLKFAQLGKVVTVYGETALLVSHLSSFSHIDAKEESGTLFQGLFVEGESMKLSCLKDAQRLVQEGNSSGWGQLVQLPECKNKEGLGFVASGSVMPPKTTFQSAGFIHAPPETNAIEERAKGAVPNFVTRNGTCCNWVAVDAPVAVHASM